MSRDESFSDAEANEILTAYYDKLMPRGQKLIIEEQVGRIRHATSRKSLNRAKIGKASSLEILHKLGKFLNKRAVP